jgi:hypothetical protein
MTEADWNYCDDPQPMLHYLHKRSPRRKLLFFLCACYRRAWHLSSATQTQKRNLIEVVERYAEGHASHEQVLSAARGVAHAEQRDNIWLLSEANWEAWVTQDVAWAEVEAGVWRARYALACEQGARTRPNEDSWRAQSQAHSAWSAAERKERRRQTALLRDLFGPLLFRGVHLDPAWLAWNDGCVVKLAQAAYDNRQLPEGILDPTRLAVLADALEEAGCSDAELLTHLRGPGPHVRGGWAIDLLLGKS